VIYFSPSSSSSQSGPEAYTSDALQPAGLLCSPVPLLMLDVTTSAARCLHIHTTRQTLVAKGGTCGRELSIILPKCQLPRYILGSFTCRKFTRWDRRLYFPSEGWRAEDFFGRKNPTALAGFEPASLGTKGQHATSRPPKPLGICLTTEEKARKNLRQGS
jgi:hypothetical protein